MRTLFIGQNSTHLKSVESTNSYATDFLRQNKILEGSIFYTFNQLNGRGQRGNQWESEPNKNATLSIVLYPTFLSLEKQFLLNKITSLAVADLMSAMLKGYVDSDGIKIKWPNDIYVSGKKIAGILIENSLRENHFQNSVVGVGINVNQINFSDKTPNAISLSLIANKEFELFACIELLCEFMEARYLQLKSNMLKSIDSEYLQRLYLFDQWHKYHFNEESFDGKIIGVSVYGKLQVQLKSDEVREFDLKEIVF